MRTILTAPNRTVHYVKTSGLIFFLFLLTDNSSFSQTIPPYVPASGLIGWWPFNANANDESGNSNDGTVVGATLTSDRYSNSNSAYLFDGNAAYIKINNILLPGSYTSFSISFWCNTSDTLQQAVISDRDTSDYGYKYISNTASLNNYNMAGGIANDNTTVIERVITTSANQANGQWNHIALTLNSSTNELKIYFNGLPQDTNVIDTLCWPSHDNPTYIGAISGPLGFAQFFNGSIDDIGFWNRSLTDSEIWGLYLSETSDVSEIVSPDIRVYPNPSNGRISLSGNLNGVEHIEVYATTGELIYSLSPAATYDLILPDGMYIMKMQISGIVFSKKLLITSN